MVVEFLARKMAILGSGGNYLYVKESAASFTKIGAPYPPAFIVISTLQSDKYFIVSKDKAFRSKVLFSVYFPKRLG